MNAIIHPLLQAFAIVWGLPLGYKIPLVALIGTLSLMGIRTVDHWVRSMRKDPIGLGCQGIVYLSLMALGFQLVYVGLCSIIAPLTMAISSVRALVAASRPTGEPTKFRYL